MIVKFKEVCHIQKLVPKVNAYASFHKIQSKPTVPLQALIIHQPLLESRQKKKQLNNLLDMGVHVLTICTYPSYYSICLMITMNV